MTLRAARRASHRWTLLATLSLLFSTAAAGQNYDCPPLPSDTWQWQVLRTPDTTLCRALRSESGTEAFAITFSSRPVFKPKAEDRAEPLTVAGQPLHWYRSGIAGRPNELIRETLIPWGRSFAHVFIRTNSAEDLAEIQATVAGLDFNVDAGNE